MQVKVKERRLDEITKALPKLQIGQEDLKEMQDIPIAILEHVLQVPGHLFKYDSALDKNIPI